MDFHQSAYAMLQCKAGGLHVIKDPGNAKIIDNSSAGDDAVVLATVAAGTAEYRLLPPTANLGPQTHLTIIAATVGSGGTLLWKDSAGTTLPTLPTLSAAGDRLELVVSQSGTTKLWTVASATGTLLFPLSMEGWKVWDALLTPLGLTALSADDLIFTPGTFGTTSPTLKGSDVGGSNATQYGRKLVRVPANYVTGGAMSIVITGAVARVADVHALADAIAYRTSAPSTSLFSASWDTQNINSVTAVTCTRPFIVTSMAPGDVLDVRIATDVEDVGDAGANINSIISEVHLAALCYL